MKNIVDTCYQCSLGFVRTSAANNKKSDFDMMYETLQKRLLSAISKVCHYPSIKKLLMEKMITDVPDTWLLCGDNDHRSSLHEGIVRIVTGDFITSWCTMINRHVSGAAENMKDYPVFQEAVEIYRKNYP